ncbi:MAG: site-specific DNA-methyltransferase [Candidatus Aenigmatarchaeota archaeon]
MTIDKFINKIVLGDALKLIKEIPDETIDAIITDPPYGLKKEGIRNDEDLTTFYKILPECYRVLKNNSFFITFFSTKFLPKLFINNPFVYFWQIIFYSPKANVKSPIGITKYMSCFIFKKGNPKIIQPNKDLFEHIAGTKMIEPDEGYIDHPTPKPKHFIRDILIMFTKENDLILDPFIGSGSTAIACKQLNRNFIGFEINPKYVKLANKRLANIW